MEGWIRLYRKVKIHWLWDEKRKFSRFEAWIDCLLRANHKDAQVVLGNELIEVKRGSFLTSIRKLSEEWGWSNTKVISFFRLLEKDEMLVYKSDTKKTVVAIVNYDLYQNPNIIETAEINIKNDAKTTQKHTDNNDNNDKNNIYRLQKPEIPPPPYQKIVDLYHKTCPSLPKIRYLTDKRKKMIQARWKKYNDLQTFEEVFRKAESSDFLSGRSGKWTCSFDWLLVEANMIKVLENNYKNKGVDKERDSTEQTLEFYGKMG